MRPARFLAILAAVAWVNFVVSAMLLGHPDILSWVTATLVTCLAVTLAATPQPTGPTCPECGQPARPTPFCLGCGRLPRVQRNGGQSAR
jgi:hypothetical protein